MLIVTCCCCARYSSAACMHAMAALAIGSRGSHSGLCASSFINSYLTMRSIHTRAHTHTHVKRTANVAWVGVQIYSHTTQTQSWRLPFAFSLGDRLGKQLDNWGSGTQRWQFRLTGVQDRRLIQDIRLCCRSESAAEHCNYPSKLP